MSVAVAEGGSVFFLWSSESILALMRERLACDYPSVHLAGTYSPPFKPEFSEAESAAMIDAVNRSGADVLWVGMTAWKQVK